MITIFKNLKISNLVLIGLFGIGLFFLSETSKTYAACGWACHGTERYVCSRQPYWNGIDPEWSDCGWICPGGYVWECDAGACGVCPDDGNPVYDLTDTFCGYCEQGCNDNTGECIPNSCSCGGGGEDDTLIVELTATPSTVPVGSDTTLSASVSGTATGTINYSFWWNCPDPDNSNSVSETSTACGTLLTPSSGTCLGNANGYKCNGVNTNPQSIAHAYSSNDTFTAKVIVERGSATPVQSTAIVTVTFIPISYTLTTSINSGLGTITGPGINCPGDCAETYFPSAAATGGTITTSGGYTIHTFNSSGTFTANIALNAEVLVVAGGGGGGKGASSEDCNDHGVCTSGGGGGAGGLVYVPSVAVSAGSFFPVAVGAGGPPASLFGGNGNPSSFISFSANGGGGGGFGSQTNSNRCGRDGGSAGGDGGVYGSGPCSFGFATPAGQGNVGGNSTSISEAGGGGGGAGAKGGDATATIGPVYGRGQGGIGQAYSISGSSITYATGGSSLSTLAVRGVYNLGNGGGGGPGGYSSRKQGARGGTGVVIIRYQTPPSPSILIDLIATPASGFTFNNWVSGAGTVCGGQGSTCSALIDGNKTAGVNFNAVPPPEADIKCDNGDGPCNISWDGTSKIEWCGSDAHVCANSGSCSVTRNGVAWASGTSGVQSTGVQASATYIYALTCSGNGLSSDSVEVVVNNPPLPTVSNVTVTEPNYCQSGPGGVVSWTYSDSNSPFSPQNGYRVQVIHFTTSTVVYDSCPSGVGCGGGSSTNNTITTGLLGFNEMYYSRVMAWNSFGLASSWTNMSLCTGPGCIAGGVRWRTPLHAYPAPDFTFIPPNPAVGSAVTFTDATVFDPSSGGKNWSWSFGGGSPGSATGQGPHGNTYSTSGSYAATLTVSDNAGGSCSKIRTINVQNAIPRWREILPR